MALVAVSSCDSGSTDEPDEIVFDIEAATTTGMCQHYSFKATVQIDTEPLDFGLSIDGVRVRDGHRFSEGLWIVTIDTQFVHEGAHTFAVLLVDSANQVFSDSLHMEVAGGQRNDFWPIEVGSNWSFDFRNPYGHPSFNVEREGLIEWSVSGSSVVADTMVFTVDEQYDGRIRRFTDGAWGEWSDEEASSTFELKQSDLGMWTEGVTEVLQIFPYLQRYSCSGSASLDQTGSWHDPSVSAYAQWTGRLEVDEGLSRYESEYSRGHDNRAYGLYAR